MCKATNAPGGLADELTRNADKAPGPGRYFENLDKNFVADASGGSFSKLTREWGVKVEDKMPSVGQYDIVTSQVTKTTKGGLMKKTDRVCKFAHMADKSAPGPGFYFKDLENSFILGSKGGTFSRLTRDDAPDGPPNANPGYKKTESRVAKKPSHVGPGYYTPNYVHSDKRAPTYSTSKEEGGGLVARMNKGKSEIPFPWYKDMPESKVQDRIGTRKHCKNLLADRKVTPRNRASAATPRAATPRAATPRDISMAFSSF